MLNRRWRVLFSDGEARRGVLYRCAHVPRQAPRAILDFGGCKILGKIGHCVFSLSASLVCVALLQDVGGSRISNTTAGTQPTSTLKEISGGMKVEIRKSKQRKKGRVGQTQVIPGPPREGPLYRKA